MLKTTERVPLDPFPTGWYAVGFSTDLPPGTVTSGTWFGKEWVLYRTESGRTRLAQAWCPHLGAHLGQGAVVGEAIECPFHKLRFGPEGTCVHNPRGKAPPAARLDSAPVVERFGAIFAWFDRREREPQWQLPERDAADWTDFSGHCWPGLATHPQETAENSVDIAHFAGVHGYQDFEPTAELQTDGPVLTAAYRFRRKGIFPGLSPDITPAIALTVSGIGFSLVETHIPQHGLRLRQLVLPTPTDGEHVELRIAASIQIIRSRDVHWLAAPVPKKLLERLMLPMVMRAYAGDVSDDHAIWTQKRHLVRPVLAEGDGPIAAYRRWCRQFYADEAVARLRA